MYLPKDKSNFLETVLVSNVYIALRKQETRWYANSEERKIKIGDIPFWELDSPWVYIKGDSRPCRQLTIMFKAGNFVPTRCLSCWKTVIRPQTVSQLIALLEFMEKLQYPSKCGLEEREFVFGHYGGYFYSNSLEDGKTRSREVKPLIYECVGKVPVYLKRFCTEFELKLCPGNSENYKQDNAQKKLEQKCLHRMDMTYPKTPQPDDLKELLVARWIRMAYSYGDITALEFNEGQPLSKQCQTYEF